MPDIWEIECTLGLWLEFLVYTHFPVISVKPGVCPRRHLGHRRCIESCFNDRDCPYIEKCCYNGCGHECMVPYKGDRCTKQSKPFKYFTKWLQCPGGQKCCRTTGGHACSEPR
uniref:WAP domain-containing protein n=1 Tax=Oreochromis aureus TaxID=47969 RepID=A0AAZ1XXN9_OREAU